MKKTVSALFLSLLVFVPSLSFAGISFDKLNINKDNTALYNIRCNVSGAKTYSTLHRLTLTDENQVTASNLPDILTCYPEALTALESGKKMQVRNRFGTAVYDFEKQSLKWVARSSVIPEKSSTASPITTSPDGSWCVFIRKQSSSTGELIIQNVETEKYVILDKNADFSYSVVPVKWSEDSKHFIYQKNDSLYFCNPSNMFKGLQLEEKYRRIGRGTINSIQWCDNQSLVYIDTDILYLIDSREFSSLGMYANILPLGKIIGRLPENYDSENMDFYVNNSATEILIIRNNNFISYYRINNAEPVAYVQLLNYRSYNNVFDDSFRFTVLWPKGSKPVIWTDFISRMGNKSSAVYLFDDSNDLVKILSVAEIISNPAISTDGRYIAFSSGESVYIYSIKPWVRVAEVQGERINALCWKDEKNLVIGGEQTVSVFNIISGKQDCMFLSACEYGSWDRITGNVIARVRGHKDYYVYDEEKNSWKENSLVIPIVPVVQNDNYRIYKSTAKNPRFDNGIYVRNLSGKTNTFALYREVLRKDVSKKKIAIVFDLMDSAEGVNSILDLSAKYKLNFTFFINGDFIRRYPKDVEKIAATENEVGSLFYSCMDLTSKDFEITEDFVRKGLARNEDEYFNCTGKELSLFWHAPYYRSNKMIREAGSVSGYNYVDYPTALESMDSKAGKTMGSQIIPVTVGLKSSKENRKFYDQLELLINSLLDADYEIVPVSGL